MSNEFKLVPIEPTPEMLRAGLASNGIVPVYTAMLAAAPQPPALGGEPEVVGKLVQNGGGYDCWHPAAKNGFAVVLLDDHRAYVAPLQAEIERQNLQLESFGEDVGQLKSDVADLEGERDQLKARLDEMEWLLLEIDNFMDREEISPGYDIELRISKVFTARAERAALSKPAGSET